MLSDLFTKVSELLDGAASLGMPSHFGQRELARNAMPPRYVWVPQQIQQEGATIMGGNPRSMGDDLHVVSIHCWGRDYDDACRLRQALVAAVRQVVNGRNYSLGPTECMEPDDLSLGYVLAVQVSFRLPLPYVSFEPTEPPYQDATLDTVVVEHAGFDASAAVAGDGVLEAGEN